MRTPVGSRLVSVVITAVVGLLGGAGLAGAHALTDYDATHPSAAAGYHDARDG